MKKIIILLAAAFIFSCSEELDQMPSNQLPSGEAIKTVKDLELAVNGAYSNLVDSRYGHASDFGLYADAKSGDFDYLTSTNQLSPLTRFQHNATSDFASGFFQRFYFSIARINDIFTVVDKIAVAESEKAKYNDLKGQMHAIRGFLHFEIARLYAQLPTAAADVNAKNSGIIISNKVHAVDATFSRSTISETYRFIVEELEKSLALLSKNASYGKINYWAAESLLARCHLYLGNNEKAFQYADDVIANSGYSLYSIKNYTSVWSETKTSESIFELATNDRSNPQRNSLGYYASPDGYAEFAATEEFAAWLMADDKDVRSKMLEEYASVADDNKAFWPLKYPGQTGATAPLYVNNPKVVRLSELYLIAAEAKIKEPSASSKHDATWYYNELRRNRIEGYVAVSSVSVDDILDERRRELFGENHRMFDLVRNRKNIDSFISPEPIAYNDYRVLVALPQRELDISGAGLVQNPGY